MKSSYTIILLSLFTVLTVSECRKTVTPDFYFKCKVDGQEYIPNNCANCENAKLLGDTTIIINGNKGFESIGLGVIKLDHIPITRTTYILDERPEQRGSYKNSTTTTDKFDTDALRTGQLSITEIDRVNNIISGTFNFEGYNPVQNKTVNVTGGSFRLKYTTY